ncbi:MAG: hypothetical protein C5B48_01965 [Candidatus Rokuibacteriota bacterium]|nr:MAG: hypothetical protein C5B48_01965 [Candidatus Rokubacteria bacterium]
MTAGKHSRRGLSAVALLVFLATAFATVVPPDSWTDDDTGVDETKVAVVSQSTDAAPDSGFASFEARFGASFRMKNVVPLPSGIRDLPRFGVALVQGGAVERKPLYSRPQQSPLAPELIRLDPREAEYLFAVASHSRQGIVEIGRLHGGSTFLLAWANRTVPIWSIDIAPANDVGLRRLMKSEGVGENVRLVVGDSQRQEFPQVGSYDVLIVDGEHTYSACLRDLEQHVPGLSPGGHVLVHDCHLPHVQSAVLEFAAGHGLQAVRGAALPAAHWRTAHGSVAHYVKPVDVRAAETATRKRTALSAD